MAIRRASKSSISTTSSGKRVNLIAGYSPAVDEMDLIERVTVGATPVALITLGSGNTIPQNYQHLQIRGVFRDNRAVGENNGLMYFNGVTGTSYSYHRMLGDGSGTLASGAASTGFTIPIAGMGANGLANCYGTSVIDILDYSNTTRFKTVRSITGSERNSAGYVFLASGLYQSTNAITSISFYPEGSSSWVQYTSISLYGVVG